VSAAVQSEWIEWAGGECPVEPDTIVDTKDRDGTVLRGSRADRWNWDWGFPACLTPADNIIAYRVVSK
jgi:hypothetical protein